MTAVLQRLHPFIGSVPITSQGQEGKIVWEFDKELAKKPGQFFHPMILMHPVLTLEYSVLCTRLAHDFNREVVDKDILIEQLVAVLTMAELLTHIYRDYLVVPREVLRLQNEKKVYRQLLASQNYSFAEPNDKMIALSTWSGQRVRSSTPNWNFPRLLIGRTRRVLTTLVPLLKDFERYGRYVAAIDPYVAPILTYASWLFFMPRLTVNIILFLKHTVPGWWMDTKEKDLGWRLRFQAQLQRRWFELGNDSLWMLSGLLNCFVLTGPLAPIGMYLTISLFLFDVIWARLRAHIERNRLSNLQKEYAMLGQEMPIDSKELDELNSYLEHLNERALFEQNRLFITLVNTHMLLFGMCFAFPALAAASPLMPFFGALIVLLTTLMVNRYLQGLEKLRPVDRVIDLVEKGKSVFTSGLTMFSPPTTVEQPLHRSDTVLKEGGQIPIQHSHSTPTFNSSADGQTIVLM